MEYIAHLLSIIFLAVKLTTTDQIKSLFFCYQKIQCFNLIKKNPQNWTSNEKKNNWMHLKDLIFFSPLLDTKTGCIVYLLFSYTFLEWKLVISSAKSPPVELYSIPINLYLNSNLGIVHMNGKGYLHHFFLLLHLGLVMFGWEVQMRNSVNSKQFYVNIININNIIQLVDLNILCSVQHFHINAMHYVNTNSTCEHNVLRVAKIHIACVVCTIFTRCC